MKIAWDNQNHREVCEHVVENSVVHVTLNFCHARMKYSQAELNVAFGFPIDAAAPSALVTSVKRAPPPPPIKLSKEAKKAQSEGSKCNNPICLKLSTFDVPHKECSRCKSAHYCSRDVSENEV